MIVVDTTVWIDFFGAKETPFDLHLTHLIEQGESLGLTDLVYCEVLQGIRDEPNFLRCEVSSRATRFSGCEA